MSVHSLISSNITEVGDLIAILDQQGIEWRKKKGVYMKDTRRYMIHTIEATIGADSVWIFQAEVGAAFVFQSSGWWFRNQGNIEALAELGSAEQQARINRQEQQRLAAVQRAREELERQRIAEEQRQIAEQQRQAELADEAKSLLAQFDAQFDARRSQPPKVVPAGEPSRIPDGTDSSTALKQLERTIGKLHQADALRKLRERLPELKEKFHAILDREEILEDETVEMKLTLY